SLCSNPLLPFQGARSPYLTQFVTKYFASSIKLGGLGGLIDGYCVSPVGVKRDRTEELDPE
ncbi:MAG TPA: hypothetical protein V6D11_28295, partial [Waterburya sp.]